MSSITVLGCETCPLAEMGIGGAKVPCKPARDVLYELDDRYIGMTEKMDTAKGDPTTRERLVGACLQSMVDATEKPNMQTLPIPTQYKLEGIAHRALDAVSIEQNPPGYVNRLFAVEGGRSNEMILTPARLAITMAVSDIKVRSMR